MKKSIILAAGEGSRMKSDLPKCSHRVCGKALVNYIIGEASKAGVDKNIVVLGHGAEIIENIIEEKSTVEVVYQPVGKGAPYGTGVAVNQGIDHINDDDMAVILCGDTPLITSDTIESFTNYHQEGNYDVTVLTSKLEDPTDYGRIIRDENGEVVGIVEQKEADSDQLKINEVNSGIYCFKGNILKDVLKKIGNENAKGEYYITDAIHIIRKEGGKIGGYIVDDSREIQGINSKKQLAEAEAVMRTRINERLMAEGAIMIDPSSTYIGPEVKIGRDTLIYPGAIIEGKTEIGRDSIIGHGSRIVDSRIADGVEIQSSTIIESSVDDNAHIGPYAYLRPKSKIGKNVKIGDFVEVKNSTVGNNSKASHLSYIGDSDVGENVNIGCGVVFVNYDGVNKNRSIVKDKAFIGCNVNLIAPVTVEENAYIAAGSTITDDVSANSLAIARERQTEKKDWVLKRELKK
jgi:bifunctional UDP-N-acetylglucosamine pyrophosphorylase / glucosamine-1-phosphate N-acetyltransferase